MKLQAPGDVRNRDDAKGPDWHPHPRPPGVRVPAPPHPAPPRPLVLQFHAVRSEGAGGWLEVPVRRGLCDRRDGPPGMALHDPWRGGAPRRILLLAAAWRRDPG